MYKQFYKKKKKKCDIAWIKFAQREFFDLVVSKFQCSYIW